MSATTEQTYLKVMEFALKYKISRTTAYSLVRTGQVPAVRVGGQIRIPTQGLDGWFGDQARRGGAP